MKPLLLVMTIAILCLAGTGCETLKAVGIGGEPDAIIAIAEQAVLTAADREGIKLSADQVSAFTAYVKARPEIDAMLAEVVRENAEHKAIRDLAESLADSFLNIQNE